MEAFRLKTATCFVTCVTTRWQILPTTGYFPPSLCSLGYVFTFQTQVMIRKLGKDRFFCQGMTPATSDQLIQYYEAHLE